MLSCFCLGGLKNGFLQNSCCISDVDRVCITKMFTIESCVVELNYVKLRHVNDVSSMACLDESAGFCSDIAWLVCFSFVSFAAQIRLCEQRQVRWRFLVFPRFSS